MAKTISLFLIDDTADGRIKCTIKGRSEIIFRIPRKDLNASKDLQYLNQDGVYFLLGEEDGQQKIYVGQASSRKNGKGILGRLTEHDRKKEFWAEAIAFTTTDNSFGATEISWLENKFCNLAIDAKRCVVMNGNEPPPGNVSEEKLSELEERVEFARLILNAIGYKMFEPLKEISPPKKILPPPADAEEIFYLSREIRKLGKKISARMIRTSTGYKVLAGSDVSPLDDEEHLSARLKELRHSEKVVDGKLIEDLEFSSPSGAAMFVLGASANGWTSWAAADGKLLKEFQPSEPQEISPPPVDAEEIFYLSREIRKLGKKISARMIRTSTGYKVLAGSDVSPLDDEEHLSARLKELRHSEKVSDGKLTEDLEFSSPSGAAVFVLGASANGWTSWATADGVQLKNLEG